MDTSIHQIGGSICSSSWHRPSYHRQAQPAGSGPQSKVGKEGSWSGLSHIPPPQANDGWLCTSACMCSSASLGLHPEGRLLLFRACLFCPPPFSRISRWSQTCKFNKILIFNLTFCFSPFHFTYCTLSLSVFFPGKHYDGVVIGKTL